MSWVLNNLFKNLLCFTIALLLSLMELQFFENEGIFSLIFLIILLVTVPTIYLYFLPKQDTIIIFIYSIILVYIIDLLGKDVNILLFLGTLFCITLLFCISIYTENVKKFSSKKASYFSYTLILIFFIALTVLLSYLIYEYILKPNINDKFELSILYEDIVEENQQNFFNNTEENIGNEGGGGGMPQIDLKRLFLTLAIIIAVLITVYILYRILRYVIWMRKTLKSSDDEKIRRIYVYTLNSLSYTGIEKTPGETPFEYLDRIDMEDFPLPVSEFSFLTCIFVSSYYGKKTTMDEEIKRCLDFFGTISKYLREKMGIKNYVLKYFLKIKWRNV